MLVGKQPGDQEDLQGRPFVGPAGRILNNALEAAKIDRSKLYVTNAVKHSKMSGAGSGACTRNQTQVRSIGASGG
jgi:uracil-DNA glycosylase